MQYFDVLIHIIEFVGIAAFAISGTLVATENDLDFFGALVLGTTTAVGGGIIRDVILGISPPSTFVKPVYVIIAASVSAVIFLAQCFAGQVINRRKEFYLQVINIFDAIGLGVFVVLGVNTAIASGFGNNAFLVIFVGTVTGVGGGVARDMFVCQTPVILRKRIYAVAAIIGASLYYVLYTCHADDTFSLLISTFAVMLIRFLATYYKWNMPKAPKW
jgi:Predicted membrane protein